MDDDDCCWSRCGLIFSPSPPCVVPRGNVFVLYNVPYAKIISVNQIHLILIQLFNSPVYLCVIVSVVDAGIAAIAVDTSAMLHR